MLSVSGVEGVPVSDVEPPSPKCVQSVVLESTGDRQYNLRMGGKRRSSLVHGGAIVVEPVAGKSGWDRELEETTNLKAMVGIELLYTRTLLQTSREIRNDIIQSHVICIILWLGTVRQKFPRK